MRCLGGRLAADIVVCRVGTDLDILGPRDLPVPANMHSPEEGLIGQRSKHSPPDISREVNLARYTIRIRYAKAVSRKGLDASWFNHVTNMPHVLRSASVMES
jgi:hypothetical protein